MRSSLISLPLDSTAHKRPSSADEDQVQVRASVHVPGKRPRQSMFRGAHDVTSSRENLDGIQSSVSKLLVHKWLSQHRGGKQKMYQNLWENLKTSKTLSEGPPWNPLGKRVTDGFKTIRGTLVRDGFLRRMLHNGLRSWIFFNVK